MIFSTLPSQQPFPYTWATKPPAAGNAGLKIIVSDLGNSEWKSDGTWWKPANGVLSLPVPNVRGLQHTATTFSEVAGTRLTCKITDFLQIPGAYISTRVEAIRTNPQTGAAHRLGASILDPAGTASGGGLISAANANVVLMAESWFYAQALSPLTIRDQPALISPSNTGSTYNATRTDIQDLIYVKANTGGAGETLTLEAFTAVLYTP